MVLFAFCQVKRRWHGHLGRVRPDFLESDLILSSFWPFVNWPIRLCSHLRRGFGGQAGQALIGFEIGFDWVWFVFAGWLIYCYKPLLDRCLSSFWAFSEIGFELGLFGFELGLFFPLNQVSNFSYILFI
jgi:hypothetical protein